MPRYFITTASQRLHVADDEGVDLPDDKALHQLVCATLADMFEAEAENDWHQSFSVYALDEGGEEVLTATLHLTIRGRPDN